MTAGGVSRRSLLRAGVLGAAAAGAAGLGAPGLGGSARAATPGWDRGHVRQPGSLPYPGLPEGTDTVPQIEHVVVLMMENHSYDNHLGMLRRPGADGFRAGRGRRPLATNPYADGRIQHAFHMPTTCQLSGHPAQDWLNSHIQFAGGRLDGFVESGSGPVSMGYWEREDLPFYYSLASAFPIADRYFCSVLGQTYPNRRYLLAATSIGQVNDTLPALSDYPANGTLFDRLDAHGITWKDYYSAPLPGTTLPGASVLLYPPLFFKDTSKVVPITQFFTDAAAGTLPGYCLVEEDFDTQSEENPQNIARGEVFAASVVNAVINGPAWDRTLLIWTFDEHGGYYDHVPPPRALPPDSIAPQVSADQVYDGFGRYGFRVPCAVVSPWARRRYVSHRVYDHSSICKLVETKWNLPAMTYRDANAHSMLDMLDLRRPAFAEPPPLAGPLLATDPGAVQCDVTGPGTIPPPGSVTDPHHTPVG
ncbi:MAG: alkaline phosphatase family protein [Micromonosporaceae bacterium]